MSSLAGNYLLKEIPLCYTITIKLSVGSDELAFHEHLQMKRRQVRLSLFIIIDYAWNEAEGVWLARNIPRTAWWRSSNKGTVSLRSSRARSRSYKRIRNESSKLWMHQNKTLVQATWQRLHHNYQIGRKYKQYGIWMDVAIGPKLTKHRPAIEEHKHTKTWINHTITAYPTLPNTYIQRNIELFTIWGTIPVKQWIDPLY